MTSKHSFRSGRVAVVAATLAALAAPLMSVAASEAAPARATSRPTPAAVVLPASAVPRPMAARLRAAAGIDLYAVAGTATMHNVVTLSPYSAEGNQNVTVWGYNTTGAVPAQPGGPTLVVNQNDSVTITLHNQLTVGTSLLVQGQGLVDDLAGAAPGSTKVYTFTANKPGTFLYEAGIINSGGSGEYQVAMGLYGALIVNPLVANPAITSDSALVLGEIDPALNNSATPASFDMGTFKPKYFTINGKPYSKAEPAPVIPATVGGTVQLHYVNAGISYHSMSVLGATQQIVGYDGNALAHPHRLAAETFGPGETIDALVTIPAGTVAGSRFAVYDANLMLHNSSTKFGVASPVGGMVTFIEAGTAVASGSDTVGPSTSAVVASPTPTNGSVAVNLSASISDAATGNNSVTSAEYFIDSIGANGTGATMVVTPGEPASASATISTAILAGLTSGTHTIYVHGRDGATIPNWGSSRFATVNLDKTGPVVSVVTATPSSSNGTANVALSATASDAATGGATIAAAEYSIDGGAAIPMTRTTPGNVPATVASLTATIPAATVAALTNGSHSIAVRAQDSLLNWGAAVAINLVVDTTGPTTSGILAVTNPNNGTLPFNSSVQAVRVVATGTDTLSNVVALEGFIDIVGAPGAGFAFFPDADGFNSKTELAYADIPLTTIASLSTGNHTIYVHAKDASGNWGSTATTILVIDKVAPVASAVVLTPPASNNTPVVVGATATDSGTFSSNIAGGEFFIDAVGANGTGTAMTALAASPSTTISGPIPAAIVGALTAGNHTVYVHAKDAAGNWSTTVTATLLIDRTAPTFTGITLSPNSITAGTASVGLSLNGATDPLVAGLASGVAGGEWWLGTADITAGTGTAFNGPTASVNTSSLSAGTYTVRVRIRDVAGNWSTGTNGVRTATLTVTAPVADAIFSDGFESGNFSAWGTGGGAGPSTANTARLNVTAGAALFGTRGMQAQGNNTNYVQYNFGTAGNPATATFDARFYFNPNSNTGTNGDILAARTTGGTTVFRVRYRQNGGTSQVQIQIGTGTGNAAWTNITNGGANRIEVVWQSGANLVLYVNGVSSQTLTTASTNSVGQVRLGSVTSGGTAVGTATLMFFDNFASKRSASPLLGP